MRRFRLCQHTKDNGQLCGSPAMRKKSYCHFHLEVVRRRQRLARMARERQLLTEAKLCDDRILGLNSYAMNILGPYGRANCPPSDTYPRRRGEGVPAAAESAALKKRGNAADDRYSSLDCVVRRASRRPQPQVEAPVRALARDGVLA